MALIKCPECGKKISDKAATCIHCGCPIEICTQEVQDKTEMTFAEKNKKGFKIPMKVLFVICKVLFAVALYNEISSGFGYVNVPILLIGSLLLVFGFLFLIFAFPKDIKGVKITSLVLAFAELLYAIGMIICSQTIKSSILIPIMCLANAVGWIAISLKLAGKPLNIFEKAKFLYVLIPILKPIIFLLIKFDFSGALLWAYAALSCALVGYIVGYEKNTINYSEEECAQHQKSSISGFLLIVFPPIGIFLLWKNKCFGKCSRIVGTILSSIWFPCFCFLLIAILIPCEHNWVGGSCTEVAVCDICGKEAETPAGHKIGEWSEWDVNYDEAVNVREKICTVCEEVIDTETEDVTTFVNGNHFTIYPNAFADRFEASSSRLNNIDYYTNSETKYDSYTFDEDNTIYYRIQDKNNDYNDIGIISFSDSNNKNLSVEDDFNESCIEYINILIEDSHDVSAVLYSAILAIDPNIDYSVAADIGQKVVDNLAIAVGDINEEEFKGVDYNGINYLLYRNREYHYIIIRPIKK